MCIVCFYLESIFKDKVQWTWSNSDAAKRSAKCLGAGNTDDLFSLVFPDVDIFNECDIGDQLNALIVGLYTETFNLVASIINRYNCFIILFIHVIYIFFDFNNEIFKCIKHYILICLPYPLNRN